MMKSCCDEEEASRSRHGANSRVGSGGCHPFCVDYGRYEPVMCGSVDGTDERAHDRALVSAALAAYKPNRRVRGQPDYTLFVGRLDFATSEDALRRSFDKYGPLRRLRLVRDAVTGLSRGYAFVEFEHRADARRAHRECHRGLVVDGRELIVEFELERTLKDWKPRRLGGGFGGRKESGQLRFGGRYRPFSSVYRRPADSKRSRS